jgi:amino acid transporter
MAIATAVTVFIIALAYNQVIELFPTGGGGYRVATKLVGPYMGLVSGCALMLDYVLTVAISIASGVDALASLLPLGFQPYKLWTEAAFICLLIVLNLRGLKEAIQVLLPIFLGFVATHLVLIVYGMVAHASFLPELMPAPWTRPPSWPATSAGPAWPACCCWPIRRAAAPIPASRRCRTTSTCWPSRACAPAR